MRTNQRLVQEFHRAFGSTISAYPTIPSIEDVRLRVRLIDEEAAEVRNHSFELLPAEDAYFTRIERVAKELADLLYVTYGAAVTWGIDLDAVLREVHASNMSKLGADGKPVLRGDGKAMKGPNYREPDLRGTLGLLEGEAT